MGDRVDSRTLLEIFCVYYGFVSEMPNIISLRIVSVNFSVNIFVHFD